MGLMRVAARTAVISGTATAVSGRVAQRQMAAAQGSAPAAPAGDESIAKVQELAALHAQGVLSDEEFAAAKAKALGI
jgi:hypothetical protein